MQQRNLPGRDKARVRRVLTHYAEQTEGKAVAEDEAAFADQTEAIMGIPWELVLAVPELLAKHQVKPQVHT